MRPKLAALLILSYLPVAALAQTVLQERTIDLPAGVSVEDATLSRAGVLVAAICSDHIVRVWSSQSGQLLRSIDENGQPPSAVQFSTDGRLLAVAYEIVQYEKGAIKVFDVGSWKVQYDLAAPFTMNALEFSPDNRRLAFSDFNTELWDLEKGKNLIDISPPFGGSSSLFFSPDGRWIASADSDDFVRVHNATDGSLRSVTEGLLLEPFAVTFLSDGKTLLFGGADKTISVVDAASGKIVRSIPKQPGLVWALHASPNGKHAVVVYRSAERFLDVNHLRLLDLENGAVLADYEKSGITIHRGIFVGDRYVFPAVFANQLILWSLR
jgi:WD40 repeat protein